MIDTHHSPSGKPEPRAGAPVFEGRVAVVTGGTDGIGAATALRLREQGADVVVLGRSAAKADALVARAAAVTGPGSLRAVIADFSRMADVRMVVADLSRTIDAIDILVQTVGILIARTEHTDEGIEKDFAVSYLSRFIFLETAAELGMLHPGTRMVNVAASSPQVPRYAQLDVTDLAQVEGRTGMRSHGQAQLANDLLSAVAGDRYGIVAIGYGPGSVRTSIRREVPAVVRAVMTPFFSLTTRDPGEVAVQLTGILGEPGLVAGRSYFYGRKGGFATASFIADPIRQQGLIEVSRTLAERTRRHVSESPESVE